MPDQSRAERPTSFDVADFPVPSGREEEWRFTPVDRLRALFADAPADDREGDLAASYDLEGPQEAFPGTLAGGQAPRGTALVPADRAAVVASAQVTDAPYVRIPVEAEYAEPLRVRVHGAGPGRPVQRPPRRRGGSAQPLRARARAHRLGRPHRQRRGRRRRRRRPHRREHPALGRRRQPPRPARRPRGSRRDLQAHRRSASAAASCGSTPTCATPAPAATATLLGVYFADAGQHLEHRSFVDHNAPHCTSLVTYKGALQGDSAHTVWVGDVLIRAEAEGTETYELNRNLVLTDGARADSVPNLEIETGEIEGAGHASATGRFDDEQLFYLQAARHPRGRRPGGSSCAASSPTSSTRSASRGPARPAHRRHRGRARAPLRAPGAGRRRRA